MILRGTPLHGALVIEPEPRADERGFFARLYDEETFRGYGLPVRFPQASISWNLRAGTLRGMHWLAPPAAEAKLVRVTRGAVHDVLVDLRARSPTRGATLAVTLSAANRRTLFVPEGVAHGFLTLEDETEVHYQMSAPHQPHAECGARWDDPAFGIVWPREIAVVSERDQRWPPCTLLDVATSAERAQTV